MDGIGIFSKESAVSVAISVPTVPLKTEWPVGSSVCNPTKKTCRRGEECGNCIECRAQELGGANYHSHSFQLTVAGEWGAWGCAVSSIESFN